MLLFLVSLAHAGPDVNQYGFDVEEFVSSGPIEKDCNGSSIFVASTPDHNLVMSQGGAWAEIFAMPRADAAEGTDLALWIEDANGNFIACDDDSLRIGEPLQPYLLLNVATNAEIKIFVGTFGATDFQPYEIFATETFTGTQGLLHDPNLMEEVFSLATVAGGQQLDQIGKSETANPNNMAIPPANADSLAVHEIQVNAAQTVYTLLEVTPSNTAHDMFLIVEEPAVNGAKTIRAFNDDTAVGDFDPLLPVLFDKTGLWTVTVVGFDAASSGQAYTLKLSTEM